MCKGNQERDQECSSETEKTSNMFMDDSVCCELCSSKATLYCQADDAFLCRKCDNWVHGANFLAQRHIRCLLCNSCNKLTQQYLIGASVLVMLPHLVSSSDRRGHCDSDDDKKGCSGTLKTPFLFL